MATLIIHAPKGKADGEGKRTFATTLQSGIGDSYAISKSDMEKLSRGDTVVVLSKDEKRRAEGRLVRLELKGRTETGMKRYDVHITDLELVDYKSEPLGRTGVSVVW
jgi:hypothetical protein